MKRGRDYGLPLDVNTSSEYDAVYTLLSIRNASPVASKDICVAIAKLIHTSYRSCDSCCDRSALFMCYLCEFVTCGKCGIYCYECGLLVCKNDCQCARRFCDDDDDRPHCDECCPAVYEEHPHYCCCDRCERNDSNGQ